MYDSVHSGAGHRAAGALVDVVPVDAAREAAAVRAVLSHVPPGAAVLDLCAGAGSSTLMFAERVGDAAGAPVAAWDECPAARAEMGQNFARSKLAARVRLVDPDADAETYELVYASHRAFAIASPEAAIQRAAGRCQASLAPRGALAVSVPKAAAAAAVAALHREGFVPLLAGGLQPVLSSADLPEGDGDVVLVAERASDRVGFAVHTHTDQAQLLQSLGCAERGVLLEDDLDATGDGRARRDAEVLCGLAASHPGPCLDLGTSYGRSAFRLATNIGDHLVTTVHMLPEQARASGAHTAHVLGYDEIGSYARERGVENIRQFYADTLEWNWVGVPEGLHLASVDACDDEEAVLQDSRRAWDRLGVGGFLVWHDFSPALLHVHPQLGASAAGIRRFLEAAQPKGAVHHLLGSWCGVLRKEAGDA